MSKQTPLTRVAFRRTAGHRVGRWVPAVRRSLKVTSGFFYTCARGRRRAREVALLIAGIAFVIGLGTNLIRPAQTAAATSNTVNFQARLEGSTGAIVPDGWYDVEFKLYSAASGGASLEWTEDYTWNSGTSCSGPLGSADCRIQVVNGYLTANLGSITAFSGINWDQQQWLTMNIGGTVTSGSFPTIGDGEMSPRLQLTAVPYAFRAGQLADPANTGSVLTWAAQGGANTIQLPNAGSGLTKTLCLENDTACGFESTSGTDFIQNQSASPQTTANFYISGSGKAATSFIAPTYTGTGTVSVTSGGTNTLSLDTGSGGGSVTIGNSSAATISIGTNNVAHTIGIGNTGATGTQAITVGGSGNTNNTVTIDAGTGSTAIQIGNSATSHGIQIGAGGSGANVETIMIGSTSSTSPLSLQAGSSGIALNAPTATFNQAATLNVASATTGTQLTIQGGAATSGTNAGGELLLQGGAGASTGASGPVIVKSNTNNSTTAFQIQGSAGASATLLNADTTNMRLGVNVTYAAMSIPGTLTLTVTNTGANSLAASTTYYYEVTAIDGANGQTTATDENHAATTSGNKTITISWTSVPGASGYRIYRGTSSGGEAYLATVTGAATTAYTDDGVLTTGSAFTVPTAANANAYVSTNVSNSDLQLVVGGNGTPTGQLYVSGTVPTFVGSITRTDTAALSQPSGVYVQGSTAYVVNYGSNQIAAYNINNPSAPVFLSKTSAGGINSPGGVYVQGRYAYVANFSGSNLVVLDYSNPSSPVAAGSVNLGTNNQPTGVYVQGRYAYVATSKNGNTAQSVVAIVDISNPAAPVLDGFTSTLDLGGATIFAQGKYLYVPENNGNFAIFDVSNPSNPVLMSNSDPSGMLASPSAVYVQGNYAYVSSANNGVVILNISNPSSPTFVGDTGGSDGYSGIYVQGRYAYSVDTNGANGTHKLTTFDVSNPSSPITVGSTTTGLLGAYQEQLFVQGRYAYVTDQGGAYDSIAIYDLGGAYVQQLEAGGLQTSTLSVTADASITGDAAITGGLQVTSSIQTAANLGVAGGAQVQGSTILAGGNNALSTPATPTVTCGAGACNTSTTWGYEITAVNASGGETTASAQGSKSTTDDATLDATDYNTVSWGSVTGAVAYKIYRTAAGGTPTSTGLIGTTSSTSFNDTGFEAAGNSPPTINTTGQLTVEGSALFTSSSTTQIALTVTNNSAATNSVVSVSASAVTSGSALSVTGGATAISNGLVQISDSGTYTGTGGLLSVQGGTSTAGTLVNFTNNTATFTGTGLNLSLTGTTSGNDLLISPGTGVTGGSGLKVTTTGTSAITAGLVQFADSGAYTGTGGVLNVQGGTQTGTVLSLTGSAVTSGSALSVTGGATAISNGLVQISDSGTYTGTGGLLSVQGGTSTAGTLVNFTNNTATFTGTGLNLSLTGTTSGNDLLISPGTGVTGGSGLKVTTTGTSAITAGLVQFADSGAYTGTGGVLNVQGGTQTGTVLSLTGSAVTSGSVLSISAGAATVTTGNAISVTGGRSVFTPTQTVASVAGAVWDGIDVPSTTVTVTGTTGITTATGFNEASFYQPTITDASAEAITTAATVFIAGAPAPGGSLTITNPYALLVNAGVSYFKGGINFSSSAGTRTERLCQSGGGSGDGVALTNASIGDCSAAGQADYAEMYPVAQGITYGDVVATGTQEVTTEDGSQITQLVKSDSAYQSTTIGIVSNNYGDPTSAGYNINAADNPYPIALNGRVPVNVTNENGNIEPGDYLTTSATRPGFAMKATQAGYVIGQALAAYTSSDPGQVMVFVRNMYYPGPSQSQILQDGDDANLASLAVNGNTMLANLAVSGDTDLSDLNVSGPTTLEGLTVTNDINTQGNLAVAGNTSIGGSLTVTGLTTVADLTINGHVITGGGQPTTQLQTAAGSGATVTVTGNDTTGTLTITTGSNPTAGSLADVLFSKVYGAAPHVVLSPSNNSAAGLRYFKGNTTPSDFMFNVIDTPAANTTYQYDYFIAQ